MNRLYYRWISPFHPLVISMKHRQFESTKELLELLVLKPQGLLFQDTCQKHMNFQIFQHLFYTESLYCDDYYCRWSQNRPDLITTVLCLKQKNHRVLFILSLNKIPKFGIGYLVDINFIVRRNGDNTCWFLAIVNN